MAIRLSFGTAGIRARLGPGDDELNVRTVRAVAWALCSYLAEAVPDARSRGLCVGFDGRTDSDTFAREVCSVAVAQGFTVRCFASTCPTPLVAFTTRRLGAAAGVMITASHNPPADNGIKVYWAGGAQILSPHDKAIAERIAQSPAPESISRGDLDEARARGVLTTLGRDDERAYLDAVEALVPAPCGTTLPRIAYTATCGVGGPLTRELLARLGVRDVVEVAEQATPRADFGGLTSPNPEQPTALALVRALAEREGAAVAFAHDPDADRLAVLVRERDGHVVALTGDEVGALLGDFSLDLVDASLRPLLVSTVVSAELLEAIANARGARFERTLTGFKWIASRARALEQSEHVTFVFGYEEAIGYAFGALGDDKDGIAAIRVLIELVARLHARGESLRDRLDALARAHGLYATRQLTFTADATRMPELVARARALDPAALVGPGARVTDYRTRPDKADLLVIESDAHTRVCVRPSGTEPKLKLYLQARADVARDEAVDDARARANAALDALEAKLRAALA